MDFHFNAKIIDGYRHGEHPSYTSWTGMKQRCYYEKHNRYENYGGRGIKVCDRWRDSFENFVEDMGIRPEGCSIERVDNEKDYCPENCYWATPKEQANNRRIRSDNRLGQRYIRFCPTTSKYYVRIRRNGVNFGRVRKTLEEAIEARDKLIQELS